jgi:hypothetical protein
LRQVAGIQDQIEFAVGLTEHAVVERKSKLAIDESELDENELENTFMSDNEFDQIMSMG